MNPLVNEVIIDKPKVNEPQKIALRRSQKEQRYIISNDYMVYLKEFKVDLGIDNKLVMFLQAMDGDNANKQLDVMKDELNLQDTMRFGSLLNCQKVVRQLVANRSLSPNITLE